MNEEGPMMNAQMISIVVVALVFIMAPIVLLASYFVKAPIWRKPTVLSPFSSMLQRLVNHLTGETVFCSYHGHFS
jgi:hypothetical protein